mgnify:CR=1 FL=1
MWNASPAAKVAKRVVKAAKSASTAIKAKAAAARNWAVDQANRAKVRLAAAKQAAEKRVARERAESARREAAAEKRARGMAQANGERADTSRFGRHNLNFKLSEPDAIDGGLMTLGVAGDVAYVMCARAAVPIIASGAATGTVVTPGAGTVVGGTLAGVSVAALTVQVQVFNMYVDAANVSYQLYGWGRGDKTAGDVTTAVLGFWTGMNAAVLAGHSVLRHNDAHVR